jgi:uncharacterized protein (TIGR00369 family)
MAESDAADAAGPDETIPEPPDGFAPQNLRGPFSLHNGPYFERQSEGLAEQAFYVLSRHCNQMGFAHGGMLSAFVDGLLATSVGRATRSAGVTIHLSIDYLAPAKRGAWVFGEARVTRETQEFAFAEARSHNGENDIVRASGVFRLRRRRKV